MKSETGELVVYREDWSIDGPRLRIGRADPVVRIHRDLLGQMRASNPWARVDGTRVEIADDYGKRFIYVIDEASYDARTETYRMEWPD